jgi:hypothetical protein
MAESTNILAATMNQRKRTAGGLRPETEVLLRTSRVVIDPDNGERIRSLARADLDWTSLLRAATAHGVMPLLYGALSKTRPDAVPREVLDTLRERFRASALRNLVRAGELLRLLALFRAHGLAPVPFKGPTLAALAYGDLALRKFNDLDILFPPRDLPRARELLLAHGYRLQYPLTASQQAACLKHQGQLPFLRDDGGCVVELHSALAPRAFHFPLKPERLEPVSLSGKEAVTLCPEDLLVYLCAHAAKHLWAYLGMACDVAELIRARPGMDWKRVFQQARDLRSERLLLVGLSLAGDLLGAELPAEVLSRVRRSAVVRALAAQAARYLCLGPEHLPGALETFHFHVTVRDRLRDGLRYALSLAVAPGVADCAFLPLPPRFAFLAYLLRPVRLALKFAGNLVPKGQRR